MIYCGDCGAQNPDGKKFCWKCGNPLATEAVLAGEPIGAQPSFQGQRPASLDRRFVAFVIDALAIWCAYLALRLFVPANVSLEGVGVPVAYFILLWGFTGTSIGKDAMGLCLVKRDGSGIGLIRAFVRCFVMFLLSVLWITWWPALLRKDRRGLHDLASGTMVVERRTSGSHFATLVLVFMLVILSVPSLFTYYAPLTQAVADVLSPWGQSSGVATPARLAAHSVADLPVAPTDMPRPTSVLPPPTQPIPTETPFPEVTPTSAARQVPTGTPSMWLLADDFVDNTNGWTTTDKMYFEGGAFHVRETDEGYSRWAFCGKCGPFTDFAYEAMISKIEGPDDYGYGITFRGTEAGNYVFSITGNGAWKFQTYTSRWNDLTSWSKSDAILQGNSTNKIRVVARGSAFEFFINDQFLCSVVDAAFSSGYLGFGVGSVGQHISVRYVRVWTPAPVSSLPPGPTPTVAPTIPPGMGGLIVANYYGRDATFTIGGKRYDLPANGTIYIYLSPGKYTWSSDSPGLGRAGGEVTIVEGQFSTQSFAASPE